MFQTVLKHFLFAQEPQMKLRSVVYAYYGTAPLSTVLAFDVKINCYHKILHLANDMLLCYPQLKMSYNNETNTTMELLDIHI